jgi:two-component system, NtrC family, response regulator HydG
MATLLGPRVLVVDDEPDTCSNLSDILSDRGYRVDCAGDGLSALELVRKDHYDVALLDLRMPGMDGLTLYREIKKLRPETVAILVTAYAGATTSDDAIEAGAWRVLPKPVHMPTLLHLVEEASDQPLILIVDDDHDLCENLWEILRDRGYRVALAHDSAGAAQQLGRMSFLIALIDMKLPDGDGGEVFRLVQKADPNSRTILITGCRQMSPLVAQVLSEGADAACYKPFDVPRLLNTLDRLARVPR